MGKNSTEGLWPHRIVNKSYGNSTGVNFFQSFYKLVQIEFYKITIGESMGLEKIILADMANL